VKKPKLFWLERGVQERGGEAPSQIRNNTIMKITLFERGIKGVSSRQNSIGIVKLL
jgi:hypothetical protein